MREVSLQRFLCASVLSAEKWPRRWVAGASVWSSRRVHDRSAMADRFVAARRRACRCRAGGWSCPFVCERDLYARDAAAAPHGTEKRASTIDVMRIA